MARSKQLITPTYSKELYKEGNLLYQENLFTKALPYLLEAAEKNHPPAFLQLGRLYEGDLSDDIPENEELSNYYYQMATQSFDWFIAEANKDDADPDALRNLGICYEEGFGVEKNWHKAKECYQAAANKGDRIAKSNIGSLHERGTEGFPQDWNLAICYYTYAATDGDYIAQTQLGDLYRTGKGVSQDLPQAFFWYQKAAIQGDKIAKLALESLLETYPHLAAEAAINKIAQRLSTLAVTNTASEQPMDIDNEAPSSSSYSSPLSQNHLPSSSQENNISRPQQSPHSDLEFH